jgi:5-(carboxyamino)imidazole ribonucleotide mutase
MNLLVLFGSTSDAPLYEPLCKTLTAAGHHVDFAVISAHRNPVELEEKLSAGGFDAVVAGAGLAAHLPGVVASKIKKPVFGVPVAAQFQGLDAVMSIQMMPRGVPVLCCGPNQYPLFVPFLSAVHAHTWTKNIDVVSTPEIRKTPFYQKEFQRLHKTAQEKGITLSEQEQSTTNIPAIVFVHTADDIPSSPLAISVPLLGPSTRALPQTALTCFSWTQEGGLWVGVNNSINALIFFTQIFGA